MSAGGRVIFDVSSIARWSGPAVGIARVENALAAYAIAHRPDIILSIYDPRTGYFRALDPRWAVAVIGWDASLEILEFEYRLDPKRLRNRMPSRYSVFMLLERLRLTTRFAWVRAAADILQRALLLARRLPPPFADRSGRRLAIVPARLALGERLALGRGDVLVTAGYGWYQMDTNAIGASKRATGFRYVAMCYDIIPLLFPEFYRAPDVDTFRDHWRAMFGLADRIIVNSRQVEADITAYCAQTGTSAPAMRVVPLGYAPSRPAPEAGVPEGLEPGRFVLFVSTIEPRKGHGMLIRVWRRLLAAGIPQRHRFKLVFVGRPGWMVDDVSREIDELRGSTGTLVHLADVSDGALVGMYRACAFCAYPSRYEGFGLPIVEAFSYGKAVIASTGGAVPETVNGLSPCLDPTDEDAWYAEIERWIEDPQARAPYEARICQSFTHPDWQHAAAQFFDAVSR
jgi:glycosyltransferase involved in cell wall biosynthesis